MANVLLVVNDPAPTTGDTTIQGWLTGAGHTVTTQPETSAAVNTGYDVVVVTESGSAANGGKWDTCSLPVVNLEVGAWITMRMSSANGTGATDGGLWTLTSGHAITTAFGATSADISTGSGTYSVEVTTLPAGVTVVATSNGLTPTRSGLFVAEPGATLTTGTAPARRVCMGISDGNVNATNGSANGPTLFLKAVEWAAAPAAIVGEGDAWSSWSFAPRASGTGGTPPHPVPVGGVVIATGIDADIVIPAPIGVQAGDVQVVCIGTAADDEPLNVVPAGWTEVGTLAHWHGASNGDGATHWAGVWVSTTDTGAVTFSRTFYTGNRAMFATRIAYRHATGYHSGTLVNTQDPVDLSQYTQHAIPAVTGNTNDIVVTGVFSEDASLPTFTPPTGFTERVDKQNNDVIADDPLVITLADKVMTSNGTINGTFVSNFACYGSVYSMVLTATEPPPPPQDAIEIINLTTGGTSTDGTTFTTQAVAPAANSTVLLTVNAMTRTATQPPVPTVSGCNLSWTMVAQTDHDTAGSTDRASTFLFRGTSATPITGSITLTFGATLGEVAWVVDHVTGANASSPIVNVITAKGTNATTALTATLPAFADASGNAAYASFGVQASGTANVFTPEAGWTGLVTTPSTAWVHAFSAWRTGEDTTPSGTWTASGRAGIIAVELARAPGARDGFATGTHTWAASAAGDNGNPQGGAVSGTHTWSAVANGTDAPQQLPGGPLYGVEPEAGGSLTGPWSDSNGNLYRIVEVYAGALEPGYNTPTMLKSVDQGATWAQVDAANRPGASSSGAYNDLEAVWLAQDKPNKLLWLTWYKGDSRWFAAAFRTSDHPTSPDTWDTGTYQTSAGVERFDQAPYAERPDEVSVTSVVLSNGDVRTVLRGGVETANGPQVLFHRYRSAATGAWNLAPAAIGEGSNDVCKPGMVLGANDTAHLFYLDRTAGQIRYRTIAADGTTSASVRVDATGANNAANYDNNLVNPVHYRDGGTSVVTVGWVNATNLLKTVEVRGGVVGSELTVDGNAVTVNPNNSAGATTGTEGPSAALVAHGQTLYAIWGDATSGDLYYATKPNGGTWGARQLLADTGTGNAVHWVSALPVAHGVAQYIGFTYDVGPHADDGSAIYYDRLNLPSGNEGSATGAHAWAGTALASRPTQGSAAGSDAWGGAATGAFVARGSAAGSGTWTASATGALTAKASAAGTQAWTGTSTGAHVAHSQVTGPHTWDGVSAGVRTPKGYLTCPHAWSGATAGSAPIVPAKSGSGAGGHTWSATATGSAPVISGSLGYIVAGPHTWAGDAGGQRSPKGGSNESHQWTGLASGHRVSRGAAGGGQTWDGWGNGTAPTVGGKAGGSNGAFAWFGQAIGLGPTVEDAAGTTSGEHAWTAITQGQRTSSGTAAGTDLWAGSAEGDRTSRGAAQPAVHVWSGTSLGVRTPKGDGSVAHAWAGSGGGNAARISTATGTHTWLGVGTGARASRGTATHAVAWDAYALGAPQVRGSGTGTYEWLGSAAGKQYAPYDPAARPAATIAVFRATATATANPAAASATANQASATITPTGG